MINEAEKLDRFKKAVFSDVESKADKIIAQAQAESDEKIRQAQAQSESCVKEKIAQADKEYAAEIVRTVSSQNLQSKRNILLSRENVIDKVFDGVKSRLEEFRKTSEYPKLLEKKIAECEKAYPDEKGKVYISYSDRELAEKLSKGGKYETEIKDTIELGGIMIVFEEINLALDYTFDSAFSQQRESFAARAGLSL